MIHRSIKLQVVSAAFLIALPAWGGAAEPALNILFYGNSFTNTVDDPGWRVGGVPSLVQAVAVMAGHTKPSVVNAAVNSKDLSWHIASNTVPITTSPQSGAWDYVVLQEYSTFPTDSPTWGHPSMFLNNAPILYNLVKANSPQVKPVLFETWARGPKSTDLPLFYPTITGSAPYTAGAIQMQSELHKYYDQAQGLLGGPAACGLAPVGDTFEALGFDDSLYSTTAGAGSFYHESNKGSLLAAMLLYETIYNDQLKTGTYVQMNAALNTLLAGTPSAGLGLSAFGISNSASWDALVLVPEPTSLAALGGAALLLARRRRR